MRARAPDTRNNGRTACVAAMFVAASTAATARGPEQTPPVPPPSFPAAAEQVVVDLVVTDRKGQPVIGLGPEAFVLTEDGAAQTILSFEPFVASQVEEPEPTEIPSRVGGNTPGAAPASGRILALVFDDLRMTPAQAAAARKAIADFLGQGVRPGDRVLLTATSTGVFWNAYMTEGRDDLVERIARLRGRELLDLSADTVTDSEAYRIEIQRDAGTFWRVVRRFQRTAVPMVADGPSATSFLPANPPTAPKVTEGVLDGSETENCAGWYRQGLGRTPEPEACVVRDTVHIAYARAVGRLRESLGVLERLLGSLEGTRARKSVVFVSPGFYRDSEVTNLFDKVLDASRRAHAPVSFLDTTGVGDQPFDLSVQVGHQAPIAADFSEAAADVARAASGMEQIANETGGDIVRTNDLAAGLRRIARDSGTYYLLGYTSTNREADGRFRGIEVKLAPGVEPAGQRFRVRARRGYYAVPSDAPSREVGAVLANALLAPIDRPTLPLHLTAHFLEAEAGGTVRCLLVGEVDVRSLAFQEQDGRHLADLDLAFGTLAGADDGWKVGRQQKAEMRLLPDTLERVRRDGYVLTEQVRMAPGANLAKLVVHDSASGRVGSVTLRLDVPLPEAFRISTPIVTDVVEPGDPGSGPRPRAIARRDFASGAKLFVSFDVYGARDAPNDHRPRVTTRFEVDRPNGEALASVPSRPVEPAPDGGLHRLFAIPLDKAQAGDYQVVVEATDEVSGKTVLWTETIRVLGPS